jgi:hypothetical protein
MIAFDDEAFDDLAGAVGFCLENIRHPRCDLEMAGRFYEDAAEALRAHAILRLLVDADGNGFSNDLVMSGHARRGWLRRCARHQYADYFLALSRSGAMLDATAGDDLQLAAEIFSLSPTAFRKGEEYEDDFYWQRFLGLLLSAAPRAELDSALAGLATVAEGARPALAKALDVRDATALDEAFRGFLEEREASNAEEAARAQEEVAVAAGTQVFIEGIAVLKLARRLGIPISDEYPMCPTLALLPRKPTTPADEFSQPA